MLPTQICLLRHGETEWNRTGRIQGYADIPLNENGLKQARAVADHLAEEAPWHRIYSSDLQRARVTAEQIATRLGISLEVEARLRERNCGILEGKTREQVEQMFPGVELKNVDWDRLPGVEHRSALRKRAVEIMTILAKRHMGQKIIVVSHGAFIKCFLEAVTNLSLKDVRLYNTGLNRLTFRPGQTPGDEGSWTVVCLNQANHLSLERNST